MTEKKSVFANIAMFASIVLLVMGSRLIPHPPNFSALLAVGLFAGAKSSNRWLAYFVPLVALCLSDLVLGMHYLMPVVAGCLLATTLIGQLSERAIDGRGKRREFLGWGAAGLISSILFFLVTNFAVWETSGMYPRTEQGLWDCFLAAIPFFHNQVLGTWLFSFALFAGYRLLASERIAERV